MPRVPGNGHHILDGDVLREEVEELAGTGQPVQARDASDPRLSPALQAMHANAGQPWTVDELAKLANMSRATFARVFQQALGQAPMTYLSDWRMTLARDLLLVQDTTLGRDRRPSGLFIGVFVRDGIPSTPRRASGPLAPARGARRRPRSRLTTSAFGLKVKIFLPNAPACPFISGRHLDPGAASR